MIELGQNRVRVRLLVDVRAGPATNARTAAAHRLLRRRGRTVPRVPPRHHVDGGQVNGCDKHVAATNNLRTRLTAIGQP